MYPLYELEQLEKWLEMKIQTLEASGGNPLEYSEVNLTKSILKFVKFMASQQRNEQLDYSVASYQYGIGMQQHAPAVRYGSNTTAPIATTLQQSSHVCDACKNIDSKPSTTNE
jgi:hypothetical protein